ncbi:MAG: sulfur transferase domain-containing protein, partial [Gammaproteobacteria bacterium]
MQKFMQMGEGVFIGGQPEQEDLLELARQGVKTVIDFREPSETAVTNARMAHEVNLDYVNIPVNKMTLSDADVEKFRTALGDRQGPFLLHCGSGARAGA